MGDSIYLAGRRSNNLYRGTVTTTPAEDADAPATALYDGEPGSVFRFGSADTDCVIDVDCNLVLNGGFETDGTPFPPSWTDISTGAGAPSKETTIKVSGSNSLKLTGGVDTAAVRQDITMLPGEAFSVDAQMYGDAADPCRITIRNLSSGSWLASGGTWSSTIVYFVSQTPASWSGSNLQSCTMESYALCGYEREVTLRIEIESDGTGYADDVFIWPHTDFVSVHGHNIPMFIDAKIQHDSDSAYGSVTNPADGTMTLRQPAFMKVLASTITERYLRLLLDGTTVSAAEIGELWMGQKKTLSQTPKHGLVMPVSMPGDEVVTIAGQPIRTARAYHPTESLNIGFDLSDSEKTEVMEMMHRGNHGTEPVVFAPFDDEAAVYLGAFPLDIPANRAFIQRYDMSGITLLGYPFTNRIA